MSSKHTRRLEHTPSIQPFLIVVVLAAAYTWFSSDALPERVASHFNGAGVANGWMPRDGYRYFMVFFVTLFPMLVTLVPAKGFRDPATQAKMNLPNRDYWLSIDQIDYTINYLTRFFLNTGYGLVVFLCYVHWLVIDANRHQPPSMSAPHIITAIVIFVAYIIWLLASMVRHFRHVP